MCEIQTADIYMSERASTHNAVTAVFASRLKEGRHRQSNNVWQASTNFGRVSVRLMDALNQSQLSQSGRPFKRM
jgi:hypothetical protein